ECTAFEDELPATIHFFVLFVGSSIGAERRRAIIECGRVLRASGESESDRSRCCGGRDHDCNQPKLSFTQRPSEEERHGVVFHANWRLSHREQRATNRLSVAKISVFTVISPPFRSSPKRRPRKVCSLELTIDEWLRLCARQVMKRKRKCRE